MYRRRATVVTFHSLRPLFKVCTKPPNLCKNLSTSLEKQDYFNTINQSNSEYKTNDFQQNQSGYSFGKQNGNGGCGQNPSNQFQHDQNRNFGPGFIENGPRNGFSKNPGEKNGRLGGGYVDGNQKNELNSEFRTNDFQQNQSGFSYGKENGNGVIGQNPSIQFQHNQNRNFGIGNGPRNEFLKNPDGENGRLGGGYNGSNLKGTWQNNGYEQNGYRNDYGQGGLGSAGNGVQRSGEVNRGFNQSADGVYSGGGNGNLQQWWGRGNYGGNYENSQHSSLKPENLQQNWNAGHSGRDLGSLKQSWNSGARPGNLQQPWNAGGDNPGNSQQSWNTDHSGASSGNLQHGQGVGYSDGSNGHPRQNWNENNAQNMGMHQGASRENYAGETLQFRQGDYNARNSGIYHGNTGFSNSHGSVIEHQQIASGGHQSDAGFVQQTSNQYQSGSVGTLWQSSAKPNQESEVVEEDQLKGTIEELDQFYQERKLEEAVDVLRLLEDQRITVDLQRYLYLLKACGEAEALEEGKSIHEHLLRSGLHLDVKTQNVILEMYCSCGSLDNAFALFDKMPNRNLTTWDTMISWLAKNGHGEDSISVFTQFKETGLRPDGRMFLGVFSACGVVGDTVEGMLHFESMKKDYSIVPSMEHYISVIDMLGTAGNLDEALEFIEKMPLEPSIEVWERLMNLCRMHGNLELGDRCAELLEALDPSRLDEQSRAGYLAPKPSELAKANEKKKSGQAFPEGRSRVHEYRAGDKSQPELYDLLRGMRQQLKEAGYIPEVKFVLHDIDHEGKEEALMAHSERLAVAQGLMTSPARNPIRIIKNLRICVDCHNTMKIVSKLVGRELIIRDAKRFHHFKDGLCSCRDYW